MQLQPLKRANGAVSWQLAPDSTLCRPTTLSGRAEVAELADAPDSKSGSLRGVGVRFPPSASLSRWCALCLLFALAACAGSAVPQAPAGTPACEGAPRVAPDPGTGCSSDGTRASFARWAQAGPGRFELQADCTLRDRRRARPALVRRRAVRLAADAQGRVDDPGRRELGRLRRLPRGRQRPFVAVNQGYEIQIDPTDNPASTTGAIYSFQAADAARRDQALRPAGRWNTYEITVDAPRLVVRLNGVVVNSFVSTSAARQSLGRGFVGLQNHADADRVSFRASRSRSGPASGHAVRTARRSAPRATPSREHASTAAAGIRSCATTAAPST